MKRKKRSTLAKKIRKANTTDDAFDLAAFGVVRAPIEIQASQYFYASKNFKLFKEKMAVDPRKVRDLPAITDFYRSAANELCSLVLTAVDARDGDTLRKLAHFVETRPDEKPWEDTRRARILSVKRGLDESKERMTLAELAKLLSLPADAEVDSLRALAKELKFPLAKGHVGRPRE